MNDCILKRRAQTKVCARPVFCPPELFADIFVVKAAYLFGVEGYLLQCARTFVGAHRVLRKYGGLEV